MVSCDFEGWIWVLIDAVPDLKNLAFIVFKCFCHNRIVFNGFRFLVFERTEIEQGLTICKAFRE